MSGSASPSDPTLGAGPMKQKRLRQIRQGAEPLGRTSAMALTELLGRALY
jgi:hypothetical protein